MRLRILLLAVFASACGGSSTEPAPWTSATFATPASRLYGFVHRLESGYNSITTSWRFMGFGGPVTTVDGAPPPFAASHQLQTSTDTCGAFPPLDSPHNCVVTDRITPLGSDGQPRFGPVWTYLLEG